MIVSCVFMTAGTSSLAALRVDNVQIAYGLLVIAGLGIGGIGKFSATLAFDTNR